MGGAPSVPTPKAPDTAKEYAGSLSAYIANAPQLYGEESRYQPLYNQLQQGMETSNAQAYARTLFGLVPEAAGAQNLAQGDALASMWQYGQSASRAAIAANPFSGQLQDVAQRQLNAGPNQTLQGLYQQATQALPGQVSGFTDLSAQTGRDVSGVNDVLQQLYAKAGTDTSAADLSRLRDQVAANTRSDIFKQTAGQVMGQLGQTDSLTQQLKDMASQQLSLGGSLSTQEQQDAAQQARAAFSARGMLNANASVMAEQLNRDQLQQQRLGQRQQFAAGVSQLSDQQAQERMANALGLTTTDIGATQANQQLAGQMTQNIAGINQAQLSLQSGLQGAIADNLARARSQQAGLQQQAVSTYQTGLQQAAGLQGSILDEMFRQQQSGTQGLQYLSALGQTGLSNVLGGASTLTGLAGQFGGAGFGQSTGGPDLFQSSGVLQLMNQNQMAQMNASAAANQMNAQSKGASSGAMIGAGAGIASALVVGVAAL